MDLQGAQLGKDKRSSLSKLVVIFCLSLTVILLAGSLVSPGRASQHHVSSQLAAFQLFR